MERSVGEAFSEVPDPEGEGGAAAYLAAAAMAMGAEEKVTRVMVAIDDSGESFYALQWALDNLLGSADPNSDEDRDQYLLTIIHVMEPFPHYMLPGSPAVFPSTSIIQSVNKAQEENASSILSRAIDMCSQRKVEAKTSVIEGDPKEMICDVAEQMQVDLIVIGSRGLGKIKRAFIGSVSNYVIHQAKCPVLVIKAPKATEVPTPPAAPKLD